MKRSSSWTLVGLLGVTVGAMGLAAACGGGSDTSTSSGAGAGTSASSTTTGSGGSGATGGGGSGGGFNPTTAGVGGGTTCDSGTKDDDKDGDGYTENDGDCNDCDANVNPGAVEVIASPPGDGGPAPTPVDEDCDDQIDNVQPSCDDNLVEDSLDPMDGAKAIGLCKFVTSAKWTLADGSPPPVDAVQLANFHLGHGILDGIGPNVVPQEGKKMLEVSSGTARKPGEPGFVHRNFDKGYQGNAPLGFPKESPSCPGVTTGAVHDATALEVTVHTPTNVKSFSFDFNFFTFEWPQYICTTYNDFFIANLTPFPMGQTDGNISFDQNGNPISVNNAFLDVCGCPGNPPGKCTVPPNAAPGAPTKDFNCSLGKTGVVLTDWAVDNINNPDGWTNGSTGWLQTSAPVAKDSDITIRFVIYDSGDGSVDSSTMIDNWQWSAEPGTTHTEVKPPK